MSYKLKLLQIADTTNIKIVSPSDVHNIMKNESMVDRECFWAFHLNSVGVVIDKELVSMGTLTSSMASPPEIFKKAIINSTAGIILVHNHPSGDCQPSNVDKETLNNLLLCSIILSVPIYDFIVIARNGYYSFRSEDLDEREDAAQHIIDGLLDSLKGDGNYAHKRLHKKRGTT
ncbi:MAG: hypothetical protein DDT41_01691 [candidate division WS2 bacterium]|nr:hypothetical protein [Candidatus Psychracetigena formicireducens]